MSDKDDVREIVQEILHSGPPVRTPWTPVAEEQVRKRAAEVAEMLRDDAERLEDAPLTDPLQAERGDTPPNATRP